MSITAGNGKGWADHGSDDRGVGEEARRDKAGDVVLFHSGYTDKYYKPFPAGTRLTFEPVVTKSKPGWPAPVPEVMDYLRKKGVWHLGTDGASMGPADGGQPTHVAGLKLGMSWEEMLIGLGKLPPRGASTLRCRSRSRIRAAVRRGRWRSCLGSGEGGGAAMATKKTVRKQVKESGSGERNLPRKDEKHLFPKRYEQIGRIAHRAFGCEA